MFRPSRALRSILLALGLALAPLADPLAAGDGPRAAPGRAEVTLAVENMFCAACPCIVRRALRSVVGVEEVTVDHARRTARVVFDPARASVEDLSRATAVLGYPSRPLPEGWG